MVELTLSQQFSLIGLNAQDSLSLTNAKKVSLRAMTAGAILELYLDNKFLVEGEILTITKADLEGEGINSYQKVVLEAILNKNDTISDTLTNYLKSVTKLSGKKLKNIESEFVKSLKELNSIEEIPNLLGCDLLYTTAGVSMREYRSNEELFMKFTESLRADILEDGEMTDESIVMLWLLRESGCFFEIFSKEELKKVFEKVGDLYKNNLLAKEVFTVVIHKSIETSIKGVLKAKKDIMATPTGIGVNFIFPFIERTQSVFIDTEAAFSNADNRLRDVVVRLADHKHKFTVIRAGKVPLIKIDNLLYEAIPDMVGRVYGVRLRMYPLY